MSDSRPALRSGAKRWNWFGVLWFSLAAIVWHWMVAGTVSLGAAAWLVSLFVGSHLAGDLLSRFVVRDPERLDSQSTRLLAGMLFVNALLLLAVFLLPFRLGNVWCAIVIGVVAVWLGSRGHRQTRSVPGDEERSEVVFLLVLPIAITAWCWDILHPIEAKGDTVVIRAWQDIYFHVCQITSFASSHGIASISDVQMSDAPVHPYHFASYLIPATLVSVTGDSSLVAYASLLVPLSLLLTALAAYCLAHAVFGRWPAMAAGLALLLLPDAFQQGFGNPYFGYHWLQQIAPGQGYGLAAAGLGFACLFEACRKAQYRLVALGYLCVLICVTYKAQFFVAISFAALIFPILFMPGIRRRIRIAASIAASALYGAVIVLAQMIPAVPTMRLDGSGLRSYSTTILALQADGHIRHSIAPLVSQAMAYWPSGALAYGAFLVVTTFGAYALLQVCSAFTMRKSFDPATRIFPWLIVAVYLVMATGLALDERKIGSPEELLHRPFVWAYFVVVVWCAGAIYHRFFGNAAPAGRRLRTVLALAVAAAIAVPVHFGRDVQTLKAFNIDFQVVPTCQFEVATFLRDHSDPQDVFQDSTNGQYFTLSALSERREFAIDTGGTRPPTGVGARLEALRSLKTTSDPAVAIGFMEANAIKWYVVDRADHPAWADNVAKPPAFECGGYRAYRF